MEAHRAGADSCPYEVDPHRVLKNLEQQEKFSP